jgi:TonB family protein
MHHLFALMAALSGAGMDVPPLPATGKWVVDYQEQACLLSRRFGQETPPVFLAFEPSMAHAEGKLVLVFPDPEKPGKGNGKARIRLQPSGQVLTADFFSSPLSDGRRGVVLWISDPEVASLTEAKTITVELGKAPPISLQTGGMVGALRAVRTCQDDLLKTWGADPAGQIDNLNMPPVSSWFSGDSYPAEALTQKAEGRTIALVTVGDNGKPIECRTVMSSGNEALDRGTCAVALRRGRFPKAVRDPKLAARWMLLPVRWVIPGAAYE